MHSLINECRAHFGTAPRRFGWRERQFLKPAAPPWVAKDPLKRVMKDRDLLLREGRVVLGALVMANSALYHPGPHDLPAFALWSEDVFFEENPQRLREVALAIYALKDKAAEGDWAEITRLVNDDFSRPLSHLLPASFVAAQELEDRKLFLSAPLLFRRHLPSGVLGSTLLPFLVLPEQTPSVVMLPGKFWPDALKDR